MYAFKNYVPPLSYDWLTRFHDIVIKVTLPEKQFRGALIEELSPGNYETILAFGSDFVPTALIKRIKSCTKNPGYRTIFLVRC